MASRILRRIDEDSEDTRIDLTAMVDVVFLLLIFFLLGSTIQNRTDLAVELPSVDGEGASKTEKMDEMTVTEDGRFLWNGTPLSSLPQQVDLVQDGQVRLVADRGVRHEMVVRALELIRRSGATGVVIEATKK